MTTDDEDSSALVPRRLDQLVALIKMDIQHGEEAAQTALEFYAAAGDKMLAAKSMLPHGEFMRWVERNVGVSYKHAHTYMLLARKAAGDTSFLKDVSSLSEAIRKIRRPKHNKPRRALRGDAESLTTKREELKRDDERPAQRDLALRLIFSGYEVLAAILHPDKDGDPSEAMVQLGAVRDRLFRLVSDWIDV